jgi:C-terminal peptidase prc
MFLVSNAPPPPFDQVALLLRPARGGPDRTLTLTREKVAFPAATSSLCGDGATGYLRLPSFSRATPAAAAAALASLTAAGATRFVLDLRDNGGGVFPAAVDVARQWLPAARDIILIADAAGVRDSYESDGATLVPPAAPLTILVNRGTASAAEVLAGALRDNGRAVVAGEPTFGKGLIQTVVPLSDGSAVAVTVARYQTPAGDDINRVGIPPDLALDDGGLNILPIGDGFCAAAGKEGAPDLFAVKPVRRAVAKV